MKTQITAPEINTLTTEVQSLLSPLTAGEFQKYYAKGVEKAEAAEDWHKLRLQVGKYKDGEYAKLGKAYCLNDKEGVRGSQLMIAKITAMQLGFESLIQSQL